MKLTTIVVDDEPLSLGMLESYAQRASFLDFKGAYNNAPEALDAVRGGEINLVFLDIQMPDMTGLELSRMLPPATKVVFTTAFEQYAIEGFKVDAVDYLLKPIRYAEFLRAAERARVRIESSNAVRSIFIKTDTLAVNVNFEDIQYVEAAGDYVIVHLDDGIKYMTHMTMKEMGDRLPSNLFFRVHRSYIANLSCISSFDRYGIHYGDAYIPIADSVKEEFKARVLNR